MRRWGWVLIASAIWTFYVWGTRVVNIAGSDNTAGFKVVHYVLAVVSIVFAALIGYVGAKLVRTK